MAANYAGVILIIFIHKILMSASEDTAWEECSYSCGGGIQRMKKNKNETRMCNTFACPEDAGCITTHFTFETLMDGRVYDTSNNANHGVMKGRASLDEDGKFGKCLHLPKNSNISLGSRTFHNKPRSAVTIASWVKIASTEGSHEIFHSCGSGVPNSPGQYHFEVVDGKVRWFHRDHIGRTVFKVESEANIAVSTWTHVAGTYRASTRLAKIYINGESAKLSQNSQLSKFGGAAKIYALSPEWACAIIGDYKNQRPLDGYLDDFFIFKCELMALEIKELFATGSFKRHGIPMP